MAIWNLGGINIDNVYSVPHLPVPGETLDATDRNVFVGGKGANMSVAAARAGAHVTHIGAVGADGRWARDRLMEYGVDTRAIVTIKTETAHALIFVADDGENSIIVYPGANRVIPENHIKKSLTQAKTGDWFITQNETNFQVGAAVLAKKMGLRVAYAAAPFDAGVTQQILPHVDLLILNEVEAEQLMSATGQQLADMPVEDIIVTLGSKGAKWLGPDGEAHVASHPVKAVDTTGAGDTFTGYVLAGLDRGQPILQAMQTAAKAAAIMVTRHGTADVIPDLADVQSFSG